MPSALSNLFFYIFSPFLLSWDETGKLTFTINYLEETTDTPTMERIKNKALEYLDSRAVKYVMEETAKFDEPVAIAITPDHATPCALRTHTHDPVPFIIYRPGEEPDSVTEYNEDAVEKGSYGLVKDDEFIKALLGI